MSFSSGTYSLYATGNPVVTNTTISSTWANNTLNDIATALSTCVLKDGTQTTTASVPFAVGISVTTEITTPSTTFALVNATATTLNFAGAATTINVGAAASATTWTGQSISFTGANSTNNTTFTVTNSSNAAAASHSILDVAVGGTTSTGDPQTRWTIPSGTSWYAGVDNSDSDSWKLGTGTVVGTNTLVTVTTAGAMTVADDLSVNGDSITTDDTTFNLINTTATTVNFAGGASTALNIGHASGTNTVLGATAFSQALTASAGLVVAASQAITGTVANSTISGFLSVAATTGTFTNVGGTLSTAAQPNVTSVGALNGGSITNGFGSIDIGADSLTAGAITATSSSEVDIFLTSSGANADNRNWAFKTSQAAWGDFGIFRSTTSGGAATTTALLINKDGAITVPSVAATLRESLLFSGSTTAGNYATFSNTGGNLRLGVDNSAGTHLITGGTAYGGVVGTNNATTLHLITNSISRIAVDSAGAVTILGTLGVTGATTLSAALTYGGVTLSNAVTGTGNMVLSASPTLTGTLTAAATAFSGDLAIATNKFTVAAATGNTVVAGTLGVTGKITATTAGIDVPVSALGTCYSGAYTPTLTNTTNIAASTAFEARYTRIGNNVIVTGVCNIDPTTTGLITLGISLPIASNIVNPSDVAGVGAGTANPMELMMVQPDTTNDRAQLQGTVSVITDHTFSFCFQYVIA